MKILIEIPDEIIEQDELDPEDMLDIIEEGIHYIARVGNNYNLTCCNLSSKILK